MVPHCRVAVVFYDQIFSSKEATRLRRFLELADFGFVTTGGPTLAAFADACHVAFIPNPFDTSIDNACAFAVANKSSDVFFACGHGGRADRWGQIDKLRRLHPEFRYSLHGRDKRDPLLGDRYYQAIEQSKIGLSLTREERDLCASDRMAQYLGNGLLATSAISPTTRCCSLTTWRSLATKLRGRSPMTTGGGPWPSAVAPRPLR
jgi:hypothetical protein